MKKIILCEDVELERQMLKELLILHFRDIGERVTVSEYESGENLIADIEEGYVKGDLLFLDIHLKGMNGLDTARKLRQLGKTIPVIFLTASADYAVESYEVQAAGYILKPYDIEKIKELTSRLLGNDLGKRIAVRCKRQKRYLSVDEIMYLESDRHMITIHMKDGKKIITQEKRKELRERINDGRFLHCHQSYLVNMDYIRDVEEEFILSDGTRIPIRVRERKEVLKEYDTYFNFCNG